LLFEIQETAYLGTDERNNAAVSASGHEHAFKQDRTNDLKLDKLRL